jgi:hypothetical protein
LWSAGLPSCVWSAIIRCWTLDGCSPALRDSGRHQPACCCSPAVRLTERREEEAGITVFIFVQPARLNVIIILNNRVRRRTQGSSTSRSRTNSE